jgi:solute:Na+ symporter, SSS family
MNGIDLAVIALYFVGVLALAWWCVWQEKRELRRKIAINPFVATADQVPANESQFFLAGRNLGWFAIGASLFASNIGSEHLIGLSGAGASSGLAVAQFEILACFILIALGHVFAPTYIKQKISTMPEFLERRYGRSTRLYLSVISILSYVLTKMAATIFAGAVVFETLGIPFWMGSIFIVVLTGLYSSLGGLKSVVYTDTMQLFVMLFGMILVLVYGFMALSNTPQGLAVVPSSFWTLWHNASHKDFPWTGVLLGAPVLGIWYWCTDQFIVQRVLSAKNIEEAQKGTLFAGYLKLLPLFLFALPGVMAFALKEQGVLSFSRPDGALIAMTNQLLPTGLKGFVIAGLLAALMSSLSSVFHSCSTLIALDIYPQINPQATAAKTEKIGKMGTLFLAILSLVWIPLMGRISGQLFTYIQSLQAYISPPIAVVFLAGIFCPWANLRGALWTLFSCGVLGLLRLAYEATGATFAPQLGLVGELLTTNFLHFAFFLFVTSWLVLFVTSHTGKQHRHKVTPFAWAPLSRETRFALYGLVLLVVAMWLFFSPLVFS